MADFRYSKLYDLIDSFRRGGHRYNDDDWYYSCPLHPDYSGEKTECDCGLDAHNAKVGEALKIIDSLFAGS